MPRRRTNSHSFGLTSLLLAGALLAPPAGLAGAPRAATAKVAATTATTSAATNNKGATPAPRPAAKTAAGRAARRAGRREGQLLVGFRPDTSEQEREALAKSNGAERRRLRGASGADLWTLGFAKSADATLAALSAHTSVEFAEPNYTVAADQFVPDDSRYAEQWALGGAGRAEGAPGAGLDAARAWSKSTGSRSTVVAVIDGGIDFTHPDLIANAWANPADPPNGIDDDGNGLADDSRGWDWIEGAGDIKDPAGHGTAVAGLIAAEGGNGLGITGVMWRASLMSLRVLDAAGAGDVASAVEALDYASQHGAHVINCSFGTDGESRALRDAIERAGSRGAIVVASAGNDGRNIDSRPRYPASYDLPHVLSVTSSDRFGQLTPFANWGARGAHVAAPGAGLLTTAPGGGYREVDGTSASAALAAGVAGLVRTLRPGLDPRLAREAMMGGAARADGLDSKVSSGGLLSAAGALDRLDSLTGGKGDGRSGGGKKGEGEGKDDQKKNDAAGGAPATGGASVTGLGGSPSQGPRPEGVRGRPAMRLPDLETARRHVPGRPQAPAPVPSTLRNCPPHNPRCNGGVAPTPTPAAQGPGLSDQGYLARAGYDVPRLGVESDLALLDFAREAAGLSDSDGGVPPLELPRLFARAQGLLPALFGAAAQTGNNAAYVPEPAPTPAPTPLVAGETYNVSVTMTNTGTTTWSSGGSYRLGSQNPEDNSTWRLGRVQLPSSVAPNETVTIPFTFTAPTAAGTYNFQWRMVRDGAEWFGAATTNKAITVEAPNYEGLFEAAGCSGITGWAWHAGQPNTPIEVDLYEVDASGNDIFLARVVADQYRADLLAAGKGDGRHGFSFAPPAALRDGYAHTVKVRVANTTFLPGGSPVLSGSPKTIPLPGCAAPPGATSPPGSLVVTSASGTQTEAQIGLAWAQPAGATHYRVERSPTKSGPFVHVATRTVTDFNDQNVTRGTAYLYRVCAADAYGNCVSTYGNVALATAFTFTDPTLYAGSTTAKKEHVNELRQTVNAVRAAAERPAASWAETISPDTPTPIRASHVTELRANLTEALSALNILPPVYTDPTLSTGANGTTVRKAHIEELRLRSTRVSGTVSNLNNQSGTLAASERLDPRNRTGGGGIDLLSGNFNWGLPLLSLRGRAGLDLGLSLSYNSLVWTKSGSTLYFNADEGSPAPGFRLGYPVVQPLYYDSQKGKNVYLLVTPSGARVELREVAPYQYESADSSYLKLADGGGGLLQLWTPDGTRLSFFRHGSSHYVSEVRDRNGNRISVAHDSAGRLQSVTDTLSRTVTFNYDANQNLLSITQPWAGQTHTWATFGYGVATVGANAFSGAVTTYGAQEGQALNVLTQVGLADGSSYRFEYNDYAQVRKVSRHSADNHRLAYTAYDLPANGDDCPRVSARRDWALDWNAELEAVTTYGREAGGAWGEATAPDGTRYRELFDTGLPEGWKKGLTAGTESYAGGIRQKWTTLTWTQDAGTPDYQKNPRPIDTKVEDKEGNVRRTEIDYHPPAYYPGGKDLGLPMDVKEYGSGTEANTVLRRTHFEYHLVSAYVNPDPADFRWVVGLVSEKSVYGTGVAPLARTTFGYDEIDDGRLVATTDPAGTPVTPTQHVSTGGGGAYGTGYFSGRGNLTSVKRWNVGTVNEHNPASVESTIGYNITGAAVFTKDAEGHKALVSYGDSFSDGVNRNTFAYPTAATDPDQAVVVPESARQRSYTKYHFDMGVVTRAQGVSPDTARFPEGPVQTMTYDAAGRLQQVTSLVTQGSSFVTNSYTRYVYAPGQNWVQTFATVKDLNTEAYSILVMDGAGRAYASASDFPGSTGRYRGRHTVYDATGRAVRSSSPTEMTSAWVPAGDDSSGWLYARQDYDWMGRPTYSTNPDGSMAREVVYGGCGCAGGEVTTVRDAVGRRQKVYKDALGRAVKTEILNGNDAYSTTTTLYNALDQVTRARTYQGAAPAQEPEADDADFQAAPDYQTARFSYDGHGRPLASRPAGQTADTSYEYNKDDTVRQVTDARGAVTQFLYNGRHLLTNVNYNATGVSNVQTQIGANQGAGTQVGAAPDVTYVYDAAGNRTSMTTQNGEGGSVTYTYDALSRLTSEARNLPGIAGNPYTLSYEYTVAGALQKVTDEKSQTSFTYAFDAAGQVTGVTGAGLGERTQLASDMRYRAWGALKSAAYGNGVSVANQYDARGQVTRYSLGGVRCTWCIPELPIPEGGEYQYHADGRLKFAGDFFGRQWMGTSALDRAFAYDHAGRIKEAYSGAEARTYANVTGVTHTEGGPFRQTYTHDEWGNMTGRTGKIWQQDDAVTASYDQRGRNTQWEYDAAGNLVSMHEPQGFSLSPYSPARRAYDAAGRHVSVAQTITRNRQGVDDVTKTQTNTQTYDGDGLVVRSVESSVESGAGTGSTSETRYYLRSSVLGAVVTEYDSQGARRKSYTYAAGGVLTETGKTSEGAPDQRWRHTNPVTGDVMKTSAQGAGLVSDLTRLDPTGMDVGATDPFPEGGEPDLSPPPEGAAGIQPIAAGWGGEGGGARGVRCTLDGIETDCGFALRALETGAAIPESLAAYQGRPGFSFESVGLGLYRYYLPNQGPLNDQIGSDNNDMERVNTSVPAGRWGTLALPFNFIGYGGMFGRAGDGAGAGTAGAFAHYFVPQRPGEISEPTSNIHVINTGGNTELERNKVRVLRKIEWMVNNGGCGAAFRRAGLPTPFELVSAGKIKLAAKIALNDSSYNSALGLPDQVRRMAQGSSAPSLTLRNDQTGHAVIFFGADAFEKSYFDEAVPHEFIHAAGVPPTHNWYSWTGVAGNDLSGYSEESYNDIMANCKDH